ncbi:tRNA (adenosine(37)-N6)-threonylcarbamoyltransferase complex ATPase subunit type 1 TsaE [Demequina salsinemoris]|uniref:tRNA (adenosine(37)-N6)-threonylcarbamoyltransferase complex ATPase subunit type 1 TsaE n=1 Tax=Demequina salsinemoris TaxID=577470 RepID=UPI000785FCF0|nr:tRNA (adenosine(37)-N6)-threonylcarbamoyltransferase complex ATPase subunit type 1 TsaE [Demequina salsinemoris]
MTTFDAPDAAAMRSLGRDIVGPMLTAGDLVILSGDLGAGKTTFTQGLGEALRVRGPVASPTFIIARTHPSEVNGPALVHVDAYRLSSLAELDDLDLDAALEDSVTVVEWGEGAAEQLSQDRLHVVIRRERGGELDMEAPDAGTRAVTVTGHGDRWRGAFLGDA